MDHNAALPVAVDAKTGSVRVDLYTGERRADVELIYSEYTIGRFREGYACFSCQEPFEVPFPVECPLCKFRVRDKQAAMLARELRGYTTIGPSRSLEELRAEDDELKEKQRREVDGEPMSSIWVPGSQ